VGWWCDTHKTLKTTEAACKLKSRQAIINRVKIIVVLNINHIAKLWLNFEKKHKNKGNYMKYDRGVNN